MSAKWALLRAAIIKIGQDTSVHEGFTLTVGPARLVVLRRLKNDDNDYGWLCLAAIEIAPPGTDESGRVRIPAEERLALERCIEIFANLLAVEKRTSHTIWSPLPWLAIYCDDSGCYEQLTKLRPDVTDISPVMGGAGKIDIVEAGKLELVTDRLDGLALLGSALNNPGPLGRFMQLIRVFERAFRLAPRNLLPPLRKFLASGPHNPSEEEIEEWLSARNPSAHADARDEFYLDADVNPLLPRMLEAAYDVLLNKKNWRDSSTDRREGIRPASGSTGGSDMFLTRGRDANIVFHILDGCSSYPVLLAGNFEKTLPQALWISGGTDPGFRQQGTWDPFALVWPDRSA